MGRKILVVETGGTFATSSVNQVRSLVSMDAKTVYDYESVQQRVKEYNVAFDKIRPIFTLSENLNIDLLNKLIAALYDIDYAKYDGVIITHGTDTLAYTANIVSMLFSHKKIPFLFVSSNNPLDLPEANGVENFGAAIDFISTVKVQGVYVMYRNFEGRMEVQLGSRVKQMNQIVDSYESFKNVDFGHVSYGKFHRNPDPRNPTIESINALKDPKPCKTLGLTKAVMMIYPYVGMRHDFFNFSEKVSAVVYGVYHSGTFYSREEYPEYSINQLIARLSKHNIPLFISEISSGTDLYESATHLMKNNMVNIAYDISLENLYSKVTVAFALFENINDINGYVNDTNVFFEKVI